MATLEKLRQKGPLVALVIGFALVAFIFTDLFSNISTIFGDNSDRNVAIINGEEIPIQEYQERTNLLEGFYSFLNQDIDGRMQESIKAQVWEQIIVSRLLENQFDALGISVSNTEMSALVTGSNQLSIDPTVKQIFTNPETGEFDANQAVEFLKTADQDPQRRQFVNYLGQEIEQNRKYAKYNALVTKGLNITSEQAKMHAKERLHMVDFDFAVKKFSSIPDSTISISDTEINAYYKKHQEEFEQDHSREIAYITFEIKPNAKDLQEAKETITDWQTEIQEESSGEPSNELFIDKVTQLSDTDFDSTYYAVQEMRSLGLDSAFFYSQDSMTNIYHHQNFFRIAKLLEREQFPDTVQARHILIRPDGQKFADMKAARKFADSLKTAIENGADFAQLAMKHGTDGTAEKGGDLGKFTKGQMVPEFDRAVFNNNTGYIGVVETQYGAHVVEVTYQSPKKEKVLVATLDKLVKTEFGSKDAFKKASDFAGKYRNAKTFDEGVEKEGYTKKVAAGITPGSKNISGFRESGTIISWIFADKTKQGDVRFFDSPVDGQYVVATLTEIREEGIAPVEQVKEQVIAELRKEKKAEQFIAEFNKVKSGKSSIPEIASAVKAESNTAKNKSFQSTRIARIGDEQVVLAYAVSAEKDEISEPIIGNSGVFVIKVISVTSPEEIKPEQYQSDLTTMQNQLNTRARGAYNSLKKAAEIKDFRYKHF